MDSMDNVDVRSSHPRAIPFPCFFFCFEKKVENVLQKKISELLLPVKIKNVRVQGRGCYNRLSKTNLLILSSVQVPSMEAILISSLSLSLLLFSKRDEIQILL